MKFHQLPRSPFVSRAVFYADYGGVSHFSEWASICPLARKNCKKSRFCPNFEVKMYQGKMNYILEIFMKCTFT